MPGLRQYKGGLGSWRRRCWNRIGPIKTTTKESVDSPIKDCEGYRNYYG
jgi:hypothetical protein